MYDSGTERRRDSGGKKAIDLYSVTEDIAVRGFSILFLTAAVFICVFVFLSWRQKSTFTSSATIAVTGADAMSESDTYSMLVNLSDVTGKVKTILESKEFKDAAVSDLGYQNFKGTESVSIVGDTNLLRITVSSEEPDVSYPELEAILDNCKKLENNLTGGINITVLVDPAPATEADRSSAPLKKAAVAALTVCLLLCFALAGLSLCKDDIRDGFDVVDKTGADFLGAVYRNKKFRTDPDLLITDPGASPAYIEEIRKLAVRIGRRMTENGRKVLLLTGVSGAEGKSAAAANLAAALQQSGKKVALIKTDGSVSVFGAADSSRVGSGAGIKGIEKEIGILREKADLVIIDAAPLSESSDAVELAGAADASVLVVRRHYTDAQQIRSALSALEGAGRTPGVIVTDVRKYCAAVSVSECARRRSGAGRASGAESKQRAVQTYGEEAQQRAGWEAAQNYLVDRGDGNVIEIDLIPFLKDLVRESRRYCIALMAVMLLFGGVFCFLSERKNSAGFTAHAAFTVEPAHVVISQAGSQKSQISSLLGKMIPPMLTSDAMISIVKEDMGYAQSDKLPASISASAVTNTNLIKLSVSAMDAQQAYDVLKSVLRSSAIITDAAIGGVRITILDESGVPTKRGASTGIGKKAAAAGLLFGLLVGLAALVVKLILRDTILTEDEIGWKLKMRSLGQIPWITSKKSGQNLITIEAEGIPNDFIQSVRALCCRIEEAAQESGEKVFLVTSAVKSEGKTTAAANLALSLAGRGHRTVLVDGELRDPSVMRALGMGLGIEPAEFGLADILAGKCTLEQALVPYRGNKELVVLPGGKPEGHTEGVPAGEPEAHTGGVPAGEPEAHTGGAPADEPETHTGGVPDGSPFELWSRKSAKKLFDELRIQFDYIIVDAPQSAVVSETGLIAELADACLFLIRRDQAGFDEICEGVETFEESDCRFLGCVMRS